MSGRVAVVGGTLDIESAPGEGTTISFELPLALPADYMETVA